jgi:hypothetical protein
MAAYSGLGLGVATTGTAIAMAATARESVKVARDAHDMVGQHTSPKLFTTPRARILVYLGMGCQALGLQGLIQEVQQQPSLLKQPQMYVAVLMLSSGFVNKRARCRILNC